MDPATMVISATIAIGILYQAAGTNPIIPTSWELTALMLGGALIILLVVAIVSLSRDRHYTPVQRLLWLLVLLAAPVLGPLLWLVVGRRHTLKQEVPSHDD